MTAEQDGRHVDLIDETRLNVASLLLEPEGSHREVRLSLSAFSLDSDLVAQGIDAGFRLTRLQAHILVSGKASGTVHLECARCLTKYDQPFTTRFAEQFRQSVDLRGEDGMLGDRRPEPEEAEEDDEPGFVIDEGHDLNFGEALRQWILLSLPMRPSCGTMCPGPPVLGSGDTEKTDDRFAALAALLDDDE